MKRSLAALVTVASCGSEATTSDDTGREVAQTQIESSDEVATANETGDETEATSSEASRFQVDVWADQFAVYVEGELVGEDSASTTTERSFNAESFTFDATAPFTVAVAAEARDLKESGSGIEYIDENNQQVGDGGIIAQITDLTTGEVVAVTGASW